MAKIKFYFNESINVAVAAGLSRRGVTTSTARISGNLGLTDAEQLRYAVKNGLVIVTHDDDFLNLAAKKVHTGIVYVHQQKYSIGDFIRHLKLLWDIVDSGDMKNHVEFL